MTLDSLLALLETHHTLTEDTGAHEVGPLRGEVVFRNVSFGYRPGIEVLRDIDLKVQPGETVALVGPGGTGKTTLMALLQRLYDPTAGTIEIDGQDLRRVKPSARCARRSAWCFRSRPCSTTACATTSRFGRPDASRDGDRGRGARRPRARVHHARCPTATTRWSASAAASSSGGERQRIAIARALLKDAPILVLDEATAGLDVDAEGKLRKALLQQAKGKTTFVIANGPTPIPAVDRILVLKDGAITEAASTTS